MSSAWRRDVRGNLGGYLCPERIGFSVCGGSLAVYRPTEGDICCLTTVLNFIVRANFAGTQTFRGWGTLKQALTPERFTKNVPVIEMTVAMSKSVSTILHHEKITCMHED